MALTASLSSGAAPGLKGRAPQRRHTVSVKATASVITPASIEQRELGQTGERHGAHHCFRRVAHRCAASVVGALFPGSRS